MVSLRFLAWHFLGKHSITVCACMVCDYIIWTVKCVHNMTCFTLHLYTLLTYWFISFRMSKQVHVEIFFVLRCDTVVLGDWFWTFWDNIVVPSSKISILTEKMRPLHCLGMSRTNYIVTVSSPRRMKTSLTPLLQPKILQDACYMYMSSDKNYMWYKVLPFIYLFIYGLSSDSISNWNL